MKIKFLGTGGVLGIPVWNCECQTCRSDDFRDKRYRSVCMVQINSKNIIIDFGQDFRNQLIENQIKKIDYAFLTHNHGDHTRGMENLSTADNVILEVPKDVLQQLENNSSSMDWLRKRNKTITIRPFEKKKIDDVEIDTIKLQHDKDYTKQVTPCYGYLFTSPKYKFAYMSDYNKILEPEKLYGLDLIISDGCNMKNIGNGHVGVEGSIEVYQQFKPKLMLLTHINHTTKHKSIQEYVKQYGNIDVAYDGMELNIND